MDRPSTQLQRLQQWLGHRLSDSDLLHTALTHRSAGETHNERLEFLGDALLDFYIAEALYSRFPKATEGDLSRQRAQLVKGETLAELGREGRLGACLHLGGGEAKSGGSERDSILADAMEALIGAIYLDAGADACRKVVLRLYRDKLANLGSVAELKDPKTRLQETLQRSKLPLPEYRLVKTTGKEPNRGFEVECIIPGSTLPAHGSGRSRRRAEQAAAQSALKQIET